MRLAFILLAVGGVVAACGPPAERQDDPFTADGRVIAMGGGRGGPANACFQCHGLAGEGDGAAAPRLAGLDAGYLQKQLDDYAAGLRTDPAMQPAAEGLRQADRRAVSVWYAALPSPASTQPPLPTPAVWRAGDSGRGLVACAVCHGDGGEGVGPGNPALSGQPAAYTLDQIHHWKTARRRNDPRGVMAMAVAPLTDGEARAIAAWLERQPASPRPASDVARLSAAEAAAERLAASRGTRRPGR